MSVHVRNLVLSKVVGKTRNPNGKACSANARKQVLLSYADRANDDGSAVFVSKTRVASENEMHRDTVITATQSLLDDALIAIDDSQWEGGRRPGREGFTYVYRVVISAVSALPSWMEAKCRNSDTLDDLLVEGEMPIGRVLGAVDKPARRRRKVSDSPTLKVSERGLQSVGLSDMNYPSRTSQSKRAAARPALDGRRAAGDPEYAREYAEARAGGKPMPAPPSPADAKKARELGQTIASIEEGNRPEILLSKADRALQGEAREAAFAALLADLKRRRAELLGELVTEDA